MSASAGASPSAQGTALVSPGTGMSMFRWLEVLEKEFDKAFVDVDLLLGEIDPDQADITYEGRQKMTSLSSCFAQLCHKAQTIFQLNHKVEVSTSFSCINVKKYVYDHLVCKGVLVMYELLNSCQNVTFHDSASLPIQLTVN